MRGLINRGGTWHLRMRVPKRYAAVEPRREIHRTLETDSERLAKELMPAKKAVILAELDALLAVKSGGDKAAAYEAAMALATKRGLIYRPATEIAKAPLDEILARLDALKPSDGADMTRAMLGGVDAPGLRLSELVAKVEELSAHENRFKSEAQMSKWRLPRTRAVTNLIAALGEDKRVLDLTADDAARHKAAWKRRIATEGQSHETANKDFSNMAGMLKRFYEDIGRADPPKPYAGVRIEDRHAKENRKPEIPVEWILEKWFAKGALDGLNDEARDILLISIETGCRQSEIHDLPPDAIVLDAEIPHIWIRHEEGDVRREVKNIHSVRQVPLVGVALAAARRHPQGFPRYRGKTSYSAAVNKFLREHGLLPSDRHTIGGTRHTWESRLKKVQIESDDRGEMMGHSVAVKRDREVYGDAMPLPQKLELALKVALPVPPHLA